MRIEIKIMDELGMKENKGGNVISSEKEFRIEDVGRKREGVK